jgi:fibronectin-binding autotransporter adhesin
MRIEKRTQFFALGATILGTILFASANAPAANILQTTNNVAGTDWTAAIWGGPPPAVATSGNTYESPGPLTVRTPNKNLTGLHSTNFAGNSLQIDSGAILYLKHGGDAANAAVANLVLNGGAMTFHGGFAPTPAPVGGTLQVIADSAINSDQTGANAADIWLLSTLSGTNNLTVNMLAPGANNLILFGTNTAYSGNWSNANGGLIIEGGTTNALGSGSVILQVADASLGFNSTNNLVVGNGIFGNGSVIKWNTNTVTLNGTNTFTGSLIISNGAIQIGNGSAISTAAVISLLNGATLDASPAGGLTLNPAGQNLNCNGTVISNLAVSTLDPLYFNLSPTTNDILNVTGSLTLNGNPALNLILPGYKPAGTYRLINYSGTIQGGGSFNLVPPAGSTETFQLNTSTPGQVNLIVTGTTYNTTWVGDGSANNWDTSSPNWTGTTNVYQAVGDNVIFNDSGSSVPDIYIVAPVTPNSMTVSNTSSHYIFDGSSSSVGISTSGALTKMGANELDFTSSGNNFSGPVIIQAGTLSVGVGGSFGYLGVPSSITNNGVLQVNLGANGAAFNSPISGSGSLNITGGGASVTLGATNSYSGGTTIGSGCQLEISTSSALGSASAVILTGGRLGVNSLVGSMTVTNPVVISGDYESPGGALYVNTAGNNVTWSGPITVGAGNDGVVNQVRAVNTNVRMNFSNTVLGTNEILECTAGNTAGDATSVMTFNNNISLGSGGSLLVDGLAVVVLAGNSNVWGGGTTVGLSGNSSFVTSSTATLLVNGKLNGGALAVVNLATLGGSGTVLDPVNVDGSLAPGNSGIGTLTISNTVTFEADGAAVMEINRTNAQNADLLSATSVSYGGTLTVANIGGTLQAGDTFHLFSGAISGTFAATNLPPLSSTNLSWDTSLLNSGIIKVAGNTAPQPTITSPAVSGTNFTLQVASSTSGFNYVLQATPSLSPTTWTSIQTNAGTGGTLNFTNPITSGYPQRFYRISVQ